MIIRRVLKNNSKVMLLQTEDFAKNLDSNEIEGKLISIKQELTKIFQSEDNRDKKEEIFKDLSLIGEVLVKVKQPEILNKKKLELIDETINMLTNFKAKYSDFFHSEVFQKIESLELQLEAFKQIALSFAFLETNSSPQNNANESPQVFKALDKMLQTIESYSSHIPGSVIQSLRVLAITVIDINKAQENTKENYSEDTSNSIRAINNVAKAILWEIKKIEDNNKDPGGSSSVGSLLEYIKTSPVWVGDDFNECLEDINRNRP
jgi:hypothetical protein